MSAHHDQIDVKFLCVMNDLDKWVCLGAMLLGRLEIFTLLVLVSPTFWRH